MNARTFGRKGAGPAAIAAPGPALASRRDAFLAAERARAEDMAPTAAMPAASEEAIRAVLAPDAPTPPPTDRSLKLAYAIWFATGLFGGHRFYLRRPIMGTVQAVLFFGCLVAVLLEYHWAFAGFGISWLGYLIDGIRLKRLHLWSGRE